jgi:hypothetical protein
MRIEEFLETMNASIEHYAHWIKIFIASIVILIAYNYFFVPSVLLLSVGTIIYIYVKALRLGVDSRFNRDWPPLDETQNTVIPPVELAAPAPAPEITATPASVPASVPAPVDSKQT